jgi:hypothetical protein
VHILINIAGIKKYAEEAITFLLDILRHSPENQFPSYAEQTVEVISSSYKEEFKNILLKRLPYVDTETRQKRIQKVLKKTG